MSSTGGRRHELLAQVRDWKVTTPLSQVVDIYGSTTWWNRWYSPVAWLSPVSHNALTGETLWLATAINTVMQILCAVIIYKGVMAATAQGASFDFRALASTADDAFAMCLLFLFYSFLLIALLLQARFHVKSASVGGCGGLALGCVAGYLRYSEDYACWMGCCIASGIFGSSMLGKKKRRSKSAAEKKEEPEEDLHGS